MYKCKVLLTMSVHRSLSAHPPRLRTLVSRETNSIALSQTPSSHPNPLVTALHQRERLWEGKQEQPKLQPAELSGLNQWFSDQWRFCHLPTSRTPGNVGGILGCHNEGESATGIQWVEAREVANILQRTRQPDTTKNYPVQMLLVRNPGINRFQLFSTSCSFLQQEKVLGIHRSNAAPTLCFKIS